GESCLYPGFHDILDELFRLNIPVALTTAGPSIEAMSDEEVRKLHDVDFSLDFPQRELHDNWRAEGAFDMVYRGIDRCRSLGVTASVAMCLMKQNASRMKDMCSLCGDLGVSLRVNAYKAVKGKEFEPDYDSFWQAIQTLFTEAKAVACSEPVVNAALAADHGPGGEFPVKGSPCGVSSLRLRPGGEIMPCVYWDHSPVTMEKFLSGEMDLPSGCDLPVPAFCDGCDWFDVCRGGCSGRRLYTGRPQPDIYCFMKEGRKVPQLARKPVLKGDDYIHASYLCTIIAEFVE
ncbi:hypothetical protein DRQ25_12535, partial [Candidatus Fermentibacteria bacterium]